MKRMPAWLILSSLSLMAITAFAADTPQQVLRDSYICAMRQNGLLTDFHLYSSDPKDKILTVNLEQSRVAAADCARQVTASLAAVGLAKISASLNGQFGQFDKLLSANMLVLGKKGVVENAVLSEMVNQQLTVSAVLTQAAIELPVSGRLKIVPEAKMARDLAVKMVYTSARYVERTTQLYPRDDSKEPTIDDLSAQIERSLASLRASQKLTPDLQKRLSTINAKFRFIRGSLINYNEKSVPFTVNRHLKTMSTLLVEMADILDPLK